MKFKAVLAGASAALQIDSPRPVFYFYFEEKNSGLSRTNYFATSPNEFSLVKMDVKKSGREVVVSQANVFGAESGTLDKYARGFSYDKIAPGVYKVYSKEDLAEGEYGFYFGGGQEGASFGKIFDFGIRLPRLAMTIQRMDVRKRDVWDFGVKPSGLRSCSFPKPFDGA